MEIAEGPLPCRTFIFLEHTCGGELSVVTCLPKFVVREVCFANQRVETV